MLDRIAYGLLVFGLAKLLNVTAFKARPASRVVAWGLTTLLVAVSLVALSALKALRYELISARVGSVITPKNPLDISGAVLSSMLFFFVLKREGNVHNDKEQERRVREEA